jgi:hypothetical protein
MQSRDQADIEHLVIVAYGPAIGHRLTDSA